MLKYSAYNFNNRALRGTGREKGSVILYNKANFWSQGGYNSPRDVNPTVDTRYPLNTPISIIYYLFDLDGLRLELWQDVLEGLRERVPDGCDHVRVESDQRRLQNHAGEEAGVADHAAAVIV